MAEAHLSLTDLISSSGHTGSYISQPVLKLDRGCMPYSDQWNMGINENYYLKVISEISYVKPKPCPLACWLGYIERIQGRALGYPANMMEIYEQRS